MPSMRTDTHGIAYHANMARNVQERVSTHPTDTKPPDIEPRQHADELGKLEHCTDMQRACMHAHGGATTLQ